MVTTFDTARFTRAALTLLLLIAVVGPACLVFASSAMAAPESCNDTGVGVSPCPHLESIDATEPLPPIMFSAGPVVSFTLAFDDSGHLHPQQAQPVSRLLEHLTPLRI